MSIIVELQSKAVQELEQIFLDSGWVDGTWIRNNQAKLKSIDAPIFYRITTPAGVQSVNIIRNGRISQANLYLVYNIIQSQIKGASNKPYSIKQIFYITLHYNEPQLFTVTQDNEFLPYLDNMLNQFANRMWVIDDLGESASEANDGSDKWNYQRRLRVEKLF